MIRSLLTTTIVVVFSGCVAAPPETDTLAVEQNVSEEENDITFDPASEPIAPIPGFEEDDIDPEEAMEGVPDDEEESADATLRCPGWEHVDCVCKKTRFNCQLPNEQPGRNRFRTLTGDLYWGLEPGTPIYDGFGRRRGTVSDGQTRINFGQRKEIGGRRMVYAFAVRVAGAGTASSWIPESKLASAPLERMPTVAARNPGGGDYASRFVTRSGVPARYVGLKVVKNSASSNEAASDYFERPGGVVNLTYNLPGVGGVSTDTFPVGTGFRRNRNVKSLVINLYRPHGSVVVGHMRWVYGHVGSRYGWYPRAALR